MTDARKGQPYLKLTRDEFVRRFTDRFYDPDFDALRGEIERLAAAAWDNHEQNRKNPRTRKAGPGYADPDYELSVDWLEAKARLDAAQAAWGRPETRSRVLLVNGSPRNDGTCPGEVSKTWRMAQMAQQTLEAAGIPTTPTQTIDEVVVHPQTAALGMLQKTPDGRMDIFGLPMSFDGHRPPLRNAAPDLGADTDAVLPAKKG